METEAARTLITGAIAGAILGAIIMWLCVRSIRRLDAGLITSYARDLLSTKNELVAERVKAEHLAEKAEKKTRDWLEALEDRSNLLDRSQAVERLCNNLLESGIVDSGQRVDLLTIKEILTGSRPVSQPDMTSARMHSNRDAADLDEDPESRPTLRSGGDVHYGKSAVVEHGESVTHYAHKDPEDRT